jgi:serine/threonine protein phosphatase PrpC
VRLAAGFATNRGLVRQTNEDPFLVRMGLYVVCDGMGGARAGEVASQMACERMVAIDPATAGTEELRASIVDANERISARSLAEPRLLGMGTTLTSALMRDGVMLLGHVGDSRAYLLHEGALRQLTDDHSWVGEMVRRGELTVAEASVHPHRSVITKALGTDGEVVPDTLEVPLAPGDRLMLCSDGLSGMVSDDSIQELLRLSDAPQAVADALIAAALKGGGEDNITVVVVEVLADEDADAAAVPEETGVAAEEEVVLGPSDRGQQRSSVPGFMRPALGNMSAKLSRRPPIWARPAPQAAETEAPQKSRFRVKRAWIVTAAVVIVVLALAFAAFAVFNSNVYYVGASEGTVALYEGLPASFLGIQLSSVVELSTVSYDSLPDYQRERVDAHDLVGKEEGQAFLQGLAALQ